MRTLDSSIEIYARKLHVLFLTEFFSKAVRIYADQQKSIRKFRIDLVLFSNFFTYAKMGKQQNAFRNSTENSL